MTADMSALLATIQELAYDRTLAADDALRRIRDTLGEHNGTIEQEEQT